MCGNQTCNPDMLCKCDDDVVEGKDEGDNNDSDGCDDEDNDN